MATGIRVAVHDAGTKPDTKTGVSIGPGAETTLRLTATNRVRLPPPFQGQCTTKEYVGNSKTMQYTVNACIDARIQDQVRLLTDFWLMKISPRGLTDCKRLRVICCRPTVQIECDI